MRANVSASVSVRGGWGWMYAWVCMNKLDSFIAAICWIFRVHVQLKCLNVFLFVIIYPTPIAADDAVQRPQIDKFGYFIVIVFVFRRREFGLERFVPVSLMESMKRKELRRLIGHFLKLNQQMTGSSKMLTQLQVSQMIKWTMRKFANRHPKPSWQKLWNLFRCLKNLLHLHAQRSECQMIITFQTV